MSEELNRSNRIAIRLEWLEAGRVDVDMREFVADVRAALSSPSAPAASQEEPVCTFDNPRVQTVYDILCSDNLPPEGQHWEGFAARRIVDALAPPTPAVVLTAPVQGEAAEAQPATLADRPDLLGVIRSLGTALRNLSFHAQTSGGTAGLDEGLQAAIRQAERAMSFGGIAAAAAAAQPSNAEPVLPTPSAPAESAQPVAVPAREVQLTDALHKLRIRMHFIGWPAESYWNVGTDDEPRWVPDWRYEAQLLEHVLFGSEITTPEKPTDTKPFNQLPSAPPAESAAQAVVPLTDAAHDVLAERRRQVEKEGWNAEHDDSHGDESMAVAAACYALVDARVALEVQTVKLQRLWEWTGWASSWFKPKDRRSNLIRAAALILADIERMDRAHGIEASDQAKGGAT